MDNNIFLRKERLSTYLSHYSDATDPVSEQKAANIHFEVFYLCSINICITSTASSLVRLEETYLQKLYNPKCLVYYNTIF